MKNMRVSLKLIVSFLIVIVLSVIVGIVGIIGMYMMNEADDGLYNGNYLPTVLAGDISQSIVEERVYMRNFVIYDAVADAEAFKSAETSMNNTKKRMESQIAEYKDTIATSEDQATFDEFVKAYNNEWMPLLESVYSLGAANRTEEAQATLIAASQVAAKMDELTTKLQSINLADGEAAVNGNTSLFMTMTIVEIIVLAVAVLIAMLLAFYISSLISKPLVILTSFMNKAGGAGDIELTQEDSENIRKYSENRDEVGQCIGSTAKFMSRLHEVGNALQTVAAGDLTSDLQLLSDRDSMGISLQKMIDNLNNMFSEINSSTSQVSTGSKQIADGAQSLAQGSTEQAAAVEQLSSSISEIAQKTKTNAETAGRAASLAGTIKNSAEKGSRQMDEMMAAVKEINQASQSINKVIKVIDDIAFQTNILALNAAVEAARAGQHGKGFAVVAEEVRNLAAKSAEAAKDTGGLIANSMEKAELGARIADETSASLVEIVSGINESSQLVGEIARSSEEQSEGISQINKGIDQVAQVIQQNSATAEESAAASEEMSGQADMLEGLVAQFKLKSGGFSKQQSLPSAGKAPSRRISMPEKSSYAPTDTGEYGKY